MRTLLADHPLVAHKLTALRDERTDSPTFRRLADELVTLLAYEATRDVRVARWTSGRRSARRRAHRIAHRARWWSRSCGPGWGCSRA